MPRLPAIVPAKPDGQNLTDQQRRFVVAYTSDPAATGNASEAARRAGYSQRSAAEIGRQLVEKPHVRLAIDNANREAISGRIATKAVRLLERVIDDESAAPKLRVQAAMTILDRGGYVAPSAFERVAQAAARTAHEKPAHEMSVNELELLVTRMSARIDFDARDRREVIDVEAVG